MLLSVVGRYIYTLCFLLPGVHQPHRAQGPAPIKYPRTKTAFEGILLACRNAVTWYNKYVAITSNPQQEGGVIYALCISLFELCRSQGSSSLPS